jgi:hypothetical protein
VLGYNFTYFSSKIQKGKACYSQEQVISMLEFLIDNIFVSFGGILFQQVVGIPMETNMLAEFLPLIYPPELEVKETTDTAASASFLDLYLEFDDSGQISTKFFDKRDDFNFKIINFPNMCSNIQAYPAYGVLIFSAETEYISKRSWYRNINILIDRIRRIFL